MSVLGGTRHWAGPAVGAAIITGLLYAFTAGDHAIAGKAVFGMVLDRSSSCSCRTACCGDSCCRRRSATAALSADIAVASPERLRQHASPATGDAARRCARCPRRRSPGVQALRGVDRRRFAEARSSACSDRTARASRPSSTSSAATTAPTAGAIAVRGHETSGERAAHRIARAGIARTYQIPRPFAHLTARDNVALRGDVRRRCADRDAAEREAAALARVHRASPQRRPRCPTRSTCIRRKFLELARALASRPRLVLLDEVLSGLTPGEINEAVALIRAIRDAGATIVFVEHVMRARDGARRPRDRRSTKGA